MKRRIGIAVLIGIMVCVMIPVQGYAAGTGETNTVEAKSAVLMEATTGTILFSQNETEALSPASVTKVMTLLLVMESIDEGKIGLQDIVRISANAASMGGSQVFMREGEEFTVDELLKCCVIASANDAAVALAEYTFGTEALFVKQMNRRAEELGLTSTKFENTTGLDDTTVAHLTSARDIAIMSRELIQHAKILEYSCRWQDSIRNGDFILTNTNRLVRFYKGCTGLKTGSTDKAGYCVSVTAERDGLSLICVIMGAESRDIRNSIATKLLDYGFAHYSLYKMEPKRLERVPVLKGVIRDAWIETTPFSAIIPKNAKIECRYEIPEMLSAPLKAGDVIGKVSYQVGEKKIGEGDIIVCTDVEKISYSRVFWRLVMNFIMGARING